MGSIRVAIVGVGNCASSLVQGVEYYKDADPSGTVPGLRHVQFGESHVRDVEFVAAFDVHFAFFARTEAAVRLRILEGRRSRLEERLANIRAASAKNRERFDSYTAELERHGLDSAEREVRWLSELIDDERRRRESPEDKEIEPPEKEHP